MGVGPNRLPRRHRDLRALRPRDEQKIHQAQRRRHDVSHPGDHRFARDLRDVHVHRSRRYDRLVSDTDDRKQNQADKHVRPDSSQDEVQLPHVRLALHDLERWLVLAAAVTVQVQRFRVLPYRHQYVASAAGALRVRVRSA